MRKTLRKISNSMALVKTNRYKMSSLNLYVITIVCCCIQAEAVCPRLCECKWKSGKESVICLNANLSLVPLHLDAGTQVLDLTGNNLATIKYEEFSKAGLVNLQKVYMAKCRLKNLERYAFKHLINLVELDLSYNILTNVPSHTFDSITELRELKLSGNPIQKIYNDAFIHLTQLIRLEISDCRLTQIEPRGFVGLERSLEWLKLDGNKLVEAEASSFVNLQGLHGLELANNPWNCSCALRPLRLWMIRQNVPFDIPPVCHSPKRLQTRHWDKLDLDEFACPPEIMSPKKSIQGTEGSNVTLVCRTAGEPYPNVRWLHKNKVIANLSSSYAGGNKLYVVRVHNQTCELTIYSIDILDAGVYACVAENKAGRAESSVTLAVNKKPADIGFSSKMLIASVLTGTSLVIVLCIVAVCVCSVKKKQVLKWRSRECSREDNYEKIEMNHKTSKPNGGGVIINQDKNGEYRVVPGIETDQDVEEEESNVDASSSKKWHSNKSLEKTSPPHIVDPDDLHIPRRPLQVARDNISKSVSMTCGTYRQYSPTNVISTTPPLQTTSSFRRYIPTATNYSTTTGTKDVSRISNTTEKIFPPTSSTNSASVSFPNYQTTSAYGTISKELTRVSEDTEKNYPDLIERSSNRCVDDFGSSSKIFQGYTSVKVYGSATRAASDSGSVQDVSEIFCTLPRKKDLVRSLKYNSTDSQSPLLPESRYGSSGGESYLGSLDNGHRRMSDSSSQKYPLFAATNLNRNRTNRISNSYLNLTREEGASNAETTPAELNATPLLDVSSLESRLLSNKREIPPPPYSSATNACGGETNPTYDYHAAQLEKFLEEYRSLQKQLTKMKETCDNICQEKGEYAATTTTPIIPPCENVLVEAVSPNSNHSLEDSVDFKNFENELTKYLISENLSPSINKNLLNQ